MASLQVRIDCAGVFLQRPCLLDRITVLFNSEYVQLGVVTWCLRAEGEIRQNSPSAQFEESVAQMVSTT